MFSIEAIPCLTALPLQARLGLLFLFLPISGFSQPPLSEWRRTGFLSPWVGHCPRIRSQLGHTPPTGLVWGLGGVASLPGPLTGQKSPHRAKFVFLPRTSLPLPLKGEGLDIAFLWGFGFSLAVAFGNCWPQLGHAGPTGPVRGFAGVVPHPALKTAHRATQGRVWFHRRFLVRFFCGIPASWRSRW